MGKIKGQKNKVISRRWKRVVVPLNLPEKLWQQYRKSVNKNTEQTRNIHTEKNLTENTGENENKFATKDNSNKLSTVKTIDALSSSGGIGKEPSILRELSVKIDNSYAVQFNCLYLNEKLNRALEVHKNIYENVINAKQVFNQFSIQTVVYNKEKQISDRIIFAESELDNALNLLEKQELLLLNLQKTFHEISVPISILTYCLIEQDNMLRMSASLSKKQNEIDDLKQKNDSLENQIRKNEQKLLKTKHMYQNIIKTKDQLLLQTKRKLYLIKKQSQLMNANGGRKNIVHNNAKSLQIQAQIENLMTLTRTLKENIAKDQLQSCSCNNEANTKSKDEIIHNLNNQLRQLRKQNKLKDNEIHKLVNSEKQLSKQIVICQEKNTLQEKKYQFEITKLTSSMDNLRRKHDRWLTDRFHQKCLSIMLFEKIKQTEMQQCSKSPTLFLNNMDKNSDNVALTET